MVNFRGLEHDAECSINQYIPLKALAKLVKNYRIKNNIFFNTIDFISIPFPFYLLLFLLSMLFLLHVSCVIVIVIILFVVFILFPYHFLKHVFIPFACSSIIVLFALPLRPTGRSATHVLKRLPCWNKVLYIDRYTKYGHTSTTLVNHYQTNIPLYQSQSISTTHIKWVWVQSPTMTFTLSVTMTLSVIDSLCKAP